MNSGRVWRNEHATHGAVDPLRDGLIRDQREVVPRLLEVRDHDHPRGRHGKVAQDVGDHPPVGTEEVALERVRGVDERRVSFLT